MNINQLRWARKHFQISLLNISHVAGRRPYACKNCNNRFYTTTGNAAGDITSLDLYGVLKVTPNASQKQIKAAYYKQSLLLHPDRHPHKSNANNEKFTQLTEAYKILGDAATRKNYDRQQRVESRSLSRHTTTNGPYKTHATTTSQFHEDVIKVHRNSKIPISQRYDQWTRSHYQQTLVTRNERVKRDILRHEATWEDTKHQSARVMTVFGIACLSLGVALYQRISSRKR